MEHYQPDNPPREASPSGESIRDGDEWPRPVGNDLDTSLSPSVEAPHLEIDATSATPPSFKVDGAPVNAIKFDKFGIGLTAGILAATGTAHALMVGQLGADAASVAARGQMGMMGVLFGMLVEKVATPLLERVLSTETTLQRALFGAVYAGIGIPVAKLASLALPPLVHADSELFFFNMVAGYVIAGAVLKLIPPTRTT